MLIFETEVASCCFNADMFLQIVVGHVELNSFCVSAGLNVPFSQWSSESTGIGYRCRGSIAKRLRNAGCSCVTAVRRLG